MKPDDLNQQFADILADPILATNVSAKMVLHKGLWVLPNGFIMIHTFLIRLRHTYPMEPTSISYRY